MVEFHLLTFSSFSLRTPEQRSQELSSRLLHYSGYTCTRLPTRPLGRQCSPISCSHGRGSFHVLGRPSKAGVIVRVTIPRFELTSQRQKVSRLPPGRPGTYITLFSIRDARLFFFSLVFSLLADHERDWPACKVVLSGWQPIRQM